MSNQLNFATMEKAFSIFQIIFAALVCVWALCTMVRCIVTGSDLLYIVCFGLMAYVGRVWYKFAVNEYKQEYGRNNE